MHPNAIDSIARRLVALARRAARQIPTLAAGKPSATGADPQYVLMFMDDDAEAERDLLAELLGKHHWGRKFSETYLRGRLRDAFHQVVTAGDPAPAAEAVRRLAAEFDGLTEGRTVLVPLAGLAMEMDELAIGNVLLRNVTGAAAARLTGRLRAISMRRVGPSAAEKEAEFDWVDRQFLSRVAGHVCAEVRVVAEPIRAEEVAVEEARRAIDLLRLSALFLDRGGDRKVIGVQGEACEDPRVTVSVAADGSRFDYRGSVVTQPFSLTDQVVGRMRGLGLFALADVMGNAGRTEFEDVLLRAVHWLASAQAQAEPENALLNLVTCLETFLKPAKADPITATIAEGVAILTAAGLDARKRRKARVKAFYGMRSRLTHEGDGAVLQADLAELTGIALDLVVTMIRRRDEFRTQEDLRNWVEDQKLAGSSTTAGGGPTAAWASG